MKMWSLNVVILLLFCYACLSTGEGKVFFESKNFFNVLRWEPLEPDFPGQNVLYSVRNQRHGDEQYEIKHCQNISALSCNLTEETPLVHDVHYMAQVYGNGKFLGVTMRFKPLADTILSPPILETHTSESTLYVNVSLPLGPHGVSIADIIARSREGYSKTVFVYTLHLTHPEWAAHVTENTGGQFVVNLKKQVEYCGYVDYKPSSEWGRKESERAHFCVTLPDDLQIHWILGGAAAVAGLIILSAVCMCTYVRGGKRERTPQALILNSSKQDPQKANMWTLKFQDRNLTISEPKVISVNQGVVYATIRAKSHASSGGSRGYSPQGALADVWSDNTGSSVDTGAGSTTPNPENTSAQSSNIYGAVAVHIPEEENEVFQAVSEDSAARFPLVLQTSLNMNGQLMLHIADDTASPVSPERKPLLQDLKESMDEPSDASEWLDSDFEESILNSPTQSDCNSHFIPTQSVAVYVQQVIQGRLPSEAQPESVYKPNGVHSTLHECASTESCEDTRTDYPRTWTCLKMEEGHEDDEGNERAEALFPLGKWGLQITHS